MTVDHLQEIIGSGWSFPLSVDGRGRIALARGEADIEQAIRIILGTAKGERRMRPLFGCSIHELVFAPNNATTWGSARFAVEEALSRWEPRIDVAAVTITPSAEESNRMDIAISYRVRATKDARALVYPF